MKNVVLFSLMILVCIGCHPNTSTSPGHQWVVSSAPAVNNSASTESSTTDSTSPVPVEASTFDTEITTSGLSVDQESDVEKAQDIIKQVVASQEFKDRVLNHTVNGIKTFLHNNGLTNEEIYQKILEAADDEDMIKDNVMNLDLEVSPSPVPRGRSLLFRIFSGVRKVFTFLHLFNNLTPAGIAQNLFQMWLGKLGFTLPSSGLVNTNGSVQSAIAKIIGELAIKFQ